MAAPKPYSQKPYTLYPIPVTPRPYLHPDPWPVPPCHTWLNRVCVQGADGVCPAQLALVEASGQGLRLVVLDSTVEGTQGLVQATGGGGLGG